MKLLGYNNYEINLEFLGFRHRDHRVLSRIVERESGIGSVELTRRHSVTLT